MSHYVYRRPDLPAMYMEGPVMGVEMVSGTAVPATTMLNGIRGFGPKEPAADPQPFPTLTITQRKAFFVEDLAEIQPTDRDRAFLETVKWADAFPWLSR